MIDRRKNNIVMAVLLVALMGWFSGQAWASSGVQNRSVAGESTVHDVSSVVILGDGDYFPALIRAVDGAQREIVMSFFYFKTNGYEDNYPDRVLDRLKKASRRGVSVRLLLERGKNAASEVDRHNRNTAARLRGSGITVAFDSPGTTTHTKAAVIDGRTVLLGSHNLTASALKYNHELSVLIVSPAVAREVIRYLNSLFP
ncbi:MAG: phospholipase [Deltaproteobacteria bacterium]|nr:phospholipase [Deltaproteobacteria bacterium]MBN2687959.1 phospholipase [Deltaproteobacteria bacterium]